MRLEAAGPLAAASLDALGSFIVEMTPCSPDDVARYEKTPTNLAPESRDAAGYEGRQERHEQNHPGNYLWYLT